MDSSTAFEIAQTWHDAAQFDPDTAGHTWSARQRSLRVLLRDAVPALESWACFPVDTPDGAATAPMLAGVADGMLYRAELVVGSDEGASFRLTRDPLESVRVVLVERTEHDVGGVEIRRRGWTFEPEGSGPFALVDEESLSGPNAGPTRLEELARAIARGAGWTI